MNFARDEFDAVDGDPLDDDTMTIGVTFDGENVDPVTFGIGYAAVDADHAFDGRAAVDDATILRQRATSKSRRGCPRRLLFVGRFV